MIVFVCFFCPATQTVSRAHYKILYREMRQYKQIFAFDSGEKFFLSFGFLNLHKNCLTNMGKGILNYHFFMIEFLCFLYYKNWNTNLSREEEHRRYSLAWRFRPLSRKGGKNPPPPLPIVPAHSQKCEKMLT